MVDDRTPNLSLPLPSAGNLLEQDVLRLRDALTALDAVMATKATPEDITAAIAAVVDTAPVTMNTLKELAAAIADDPDFATNIAAQIASISAQIETIQNRIGTVQQVLATKAGTSEVQEALDDKLGTSGGVMSGPITFAPAQTFPGSKVSGLPSFATQLRNQ